MLMLMLLSMIEWEEIGMEGEALRRQDTGVMTRLGLAEFAPPGRRTLIRKTPNVQRLTPQLRKRGRGAESKGERQPTLSRPSLGEGGATDHAQTEVYQKTTKE